MGLPATGYSAAGHQTTITSGMLVGIGVGRAVAAGGFACVAAANVGVRRNPVLVSAAQAVRSDASRISRLNRIALVSERRCVLPFVAVFLVSCGV